ncbi:unnamed protein product [Protopolystoma xenopodis]|uniref:Uncharacterized protein n=1 Tax=Protopolystoma xenopodis TaxID=117903 RepID=A0A3S5BT23_9PLAT|nr:unnamed protein product [Protopolystoma xenopodis]
MFGVSFSSDNGLIVEFVYAISETPLCVLIETSSSSLLLLLIFRINSLWRPEEVISADVGSACEFRIFVKVKGEEVAVTGFIVIDGSRIGEDTGIWVEQRAGGTSGSTDNSVDAHSDVIALLEMDCLNCLL